MKTILILLLYFLKIHLTYAFISVEEQRSLFLKNEAMLKKNYQTKIDTRLLNYPLYPYLHYEKLRQQIEKAPLSLSLDDLTFFEKQFPDFHLKQTLRDNWLLKMATLQKWQDYIKGYKPSSASHQCYYHLANYELSKEVRYLNKAQGLWLVGYEQPYGCERLFKKWQANGDFSNSLIWERLLIALPKHNAKLIHHLANFLPTSEQKALKLWQHFLMHPQLVLNLKKVKEVKLAKYLKAHLVTQCLMLVAKKEPLKAIDFWKKHHQTYFLTPLQNKLIKNQIGISLAHLRHPMARTWLAKIPSHEIDLIAQEWRIRLSLAAHDWKSTLFWLNQLPENLKHEKQWLYWRARSLQAVGLMPQAKPLFHELAKVRNYYGFLSSLRLKQPFHLNEHLPSISKHALETVQLTGAIKRFIELNQIKRGAIARLEWLNMLKQMKEFELLVAAHWAYDAKHYDLAILAAGRTQHKYNLPLRFPLAYRKIIDENATLNNIDPAWVLAITRQESAFIPHAISHANARGLMQILPSTAKLVAHQSRWPKPNEKSLYHPDTNIRLGSRYLRNLKEQLQENVILASAAYNAGPGRIVKWLPKMPQSADIWIETIPFQETRDYVKNVLTYTSVYRHHLNQSPHLSILEQPIFPELTP